MIDLVQAVCPGCRRPLRIPQIWVKGLMRCKHCGNLLRSARPPSMDINGALDTNPDRQKFQVKRKHRQRWSMIFTVALPLLILTAVGAAALIWHEDIASIADGMLGKTKTVSPIVVRPEPSAPKVVPETDSTPSSAFPRRALLVGVKNYLYVPLQRSLGRDDPNSGGDAAGLIGLEKVLTTSLRFPSDQTAVLSDDPPREGLPPVKEVVAEAITQFLEKCRPQDRAVVVFTGYLAQIEGKGYLVPQDGEMADTDTLISTAWVMEKLVKCKARQKLFILDGVPVVQDREKNSVMRAMLGVKTAEPLRKPPDGVQVWLNCADGEYPILRSADRQGSVFLQSLVSVGNELQINAKRKELCTRLGLADGKWTDKPESSLPLLILAPEVHRETKEAAQKSAKEKQTPVLVGKEVVGPDPKENDPAPTPFELKAITMKEPFRSANSIHALTAELEPLIEKDRWIRKEHVLPIKAKAIEPYAADGPGSDAFPNAVRSMIGVLTQKRPRLRMQFRYPGDDTAFRAQITQTQEVPARLYAELKEKIETFQSLEGQRDQEKRRKWQAHFDYVHARLLAEVIQTHEYNYALALMKKETPTRASPQSNGWLLVPHPSLAQKETKELDKKRREILDRIVKEHAGTLWEVLARIERLISLGAKPQEIRITG